MKIVINKCFGGFGLSDAAYERLIELGIPVRKYVEEKKGTDGLYKKVSKNEGEVIFDRRLSPPESDRFSKEEYEKLMGRYWETWIDRDNRSHPLLIKVVEELGKKSWGNHAQLQVVEIPDGIKFEIADYDGVETIHEQHRSW